MKIEMEEIGPCRRKLTIEVPVETVNTAFDHVVAGFARSAAVPGFRKGRVPVAILERRFGKEILEEVRDTVVPQAYHQALKEKELKALEIVDFQPPTLTRGQPASFSITVEIAPAFELPAYSGYSVQVPKQEVTEAQIQEMYDSLRRQHSTFTDLTEGSAVADDLVQVDFTGTIDGRPIDEVDPGAKGLGNATGFWVSLNEYAFLPGFAEGLQGVAIGDSRTISSEFPETFTVKGIAGRKAEFQVTVKAIRRPVPPELNAEYYARFGCATDEELRGKIRTQLISVHEEQREEKIRGAILDKLLADVSFEGLPEQEVQQETQRAIYSMVRTNSQRGVPQDQIMEQKDKIFETASRTAQDRVKVRHILTRIAEAEKIQVSDAEVEARVRMEARGQGLTEKAYRKQVEEAGGGLSGLRAGLVAEAALRRLRETVTVVE